MNMQLRYTPLKYAVVLFLLLVFIGACTKKNEPVDEGKIPGSIWPALALLQTGANPLWFEIGPEGETMLIESPAAAALSPYDPWPHARHITGMILWENFLVMAVNRGGFLVFGPDYSTEFSPSGMSLGGDENLVLYYVGEELWEPYTVGALFLFDDKPAVLLYRNDFFSGSLPQPLEYQAFLLEKSSAAPVSVSVPAWNNLPSGWEVELLRRGPDGFWYYRAKERDSLASNRNAQGGIVYFKTQDLGREGERVSVQEWRNSEGPESPVSTPVHLAKILSRAADFGLGRVSGVRTISPDYGEPRFFASSNPVYSVRSFFAENLAILYGYYSESFGSAYGPQPLALVIHPDGRGLYLLGAADEPAPFSLPVLPEGFVYTAIALYENVIIASWEEQQGAGIGAAGFMLVNSELRLTPGFY
jgi:hypothetical protein